MSILSTKEQRRALLWAVVVVTLLGFVTLLPMGIALIMAAWVGTLARPLLLRISRALGGRGGRAAGVLVVLLVLLIALPATVAVVSLARGAIGLAREIMSSPDTKSALTRMVAGGGEGADSTAATAAFASPAKIFELVQEHGAKAFSIVGGIAGVATEAVVGVLVFLYGVYVFLVEGPSFYAWLKAHAPIPEASMDRFARAFTETGRGLFVGVGLTGLTQGIVATITYFALGIPRALVLGLLTCLVSVIPSVGTALVWVPVAIGLLLAGKTVSAIILIAIGVVVIGSVDNIFRPVFARYGKLQLPSFVLLISIFGGIAVFGTWGFILGPLAVRLAKEALEIARAAAPDEESPPDDAMVARRMQRIGDKAKGGT